MITRFGSLDEIDRAIETWLHPPKTIAVALELKPMNPYKDTVPIIVIGETMDNTITPLRLPVVIGDAVVQKYVVPASSIRGFFRKTSLVAAKTVATKNPADLAGDGWRDAAEYIAAAIRLHNESGKTESLHSGRGDREAEETRSLFYDIAIKNTVPQINRVLDEVLRSRLDISLEDARRRAGEKKLDKETRDAIAEITASLFCPLCGLYGSHSYRGAVFFNTSIIEGEPAARTHVVIDRKTMTSMKREGAGLLYTEHVIHVSRLRIKFVIRDIEPGSPAAILMAHTLSYLKGHGITLGAGKSRGYGLFKIAGARCAAMDTWNPERYLKPEKTCNSIDELISYLRGATRQP